MADTDVRQVIVVGDAAIGSMTATALAISLRGSSVGISLVYRPGTDTTRGAFLCRGGAGSLHSILGIDEAALLAQTGAVPSLGARYRGFSTEATDCFVPLGGHGTTLRLVDFHHYAAKLGSEGDDTPFNAYSYQAAAATNGQFDPGSDATNNIDQYDLVVDNERYARFMLEYARHLGVTTTEAEVQSVSRDADGDIASVALSGGDRVAGDFIIDCSGDRASRGAMDDVGEFIDWSASLPGSSTATTVIEDTQRASLCVDIAAIDCGWVQTLRLPGTRIETLVGGDAETDAGTYVELFSSGTLESHWHRNCVAIGPAATVVPPLEVSPMHLAQDDLRQLLGMLPRKRESAALAAEYNRIANARATSVRDYLALRFALAQRTSGPFWKGASKIEIPDTLQERIDLFRCHGRFTARDHEFFDKSNWVSSFINFGAWPESYDPLADMIDEERMRADLRQIRTMVGRTASN